MKRPDWWTREYDGDRIRWQAGDLVAWNERESGERCGKQFLADLQLASHVGEFDREVFDQPHVDFEGRHNNRGWNETESRYYLSRSFVAVFWRWGVAVQWRGRRIGRFDWAFFQGED